MLTFWKVFLNEIFHKIVIAFQVYVYYFIYDAEFIMKMMNI